jgi:hypothetical protein
VIEGAKGLRVGGKDAKDPPDIRWAECPYSDRRSEERGRHRYRCLPSRPIPDVRSYAVHLEFGLVISHF